MDKRRLLRSSFFSRPPLRIALLTIAGLAGCVTADAAVFWSDDDPMVMSQPRLEAPQRPRKPRRNNARIEKPVRETSKPVGPLVIAISIDRQTLKVYDANGLYAETPVSTGMKGHATPMGVFSVIQKNKYHRSNIYSGAPMPFMQRITWSGIALHAGMLPGYPASHGCIRMPMAFATRMWGWTRMGARVVITPGEVSPSEISHPLLLARKAEPAAVAALAPKDAAAAAKPIEAASAMSSASLELKGPVEANPARTSDSKRDQTQTADASGAITPSAKSTIMSDASPAKPIDSELVTRRDVDEAVAKTVELPAPKSPAAEVKASAAPDIKPDDSRPTDAPKPASSAVAPEATLPPAPAVAADTVPRRSGQIAVLVSRKDGKLYVRQNFAPLFDVPVSIAPGEQPLGTHVFTARADKDDARAFRWTAVSLAAVPHRAARSDEDSPAMRRRKSTGAVEMTPTSLPGSAAEALDRLTIPAAAMAQIADALAAGGSLIVSDQGIAAGGETGQGTEFVVPLR